MESCKDHAKVLFGPVKEKKKSSVGHRRSRRLGANFSGTLATPQFVHFGAYLEPVVQIDAEFLLVAEHLLALLDLRHIVNNVD